MKHFEDIWNKSEKTIDIDIDQCIMLILLHLEDIKKNPNNIGNILFYLSGISKIQNTNVADLMQEAIEEFKIDNFE